METYQFNLHINCRKQYRNDSDGKRTMDSCSLLNLDSLVQLFCCYSEVPGCQVEWLVTGAGTMLYLSTA